MRLQDFDYTLPEELIAQAPAPDRDRSRMMTGDRGTGRLQDRIFREFPELLRKGDVLVLNDSKVIPARLFARKTTGATVEILLLKSREGTSSTRWEALLRPAKRIKAGTTMTFDGGAGVRVLEGSTTGNGWSNSTSRALRKLPAAQGTGAAAPVHPPAKEAPNPRTISSDTRPSTRSDRGPSRRRRRGSTSPRPSWIASAKAESPWRRSRSTWATGR
jgi:hypothetical protein